MPMCLKNSFFGSFVQELIPTMIGQLSEMIQQNTCMCVIEPEDYPQNILTTGWLLTSRKLHPQAAIAAYQSCDISYF